MGLDNLALLEQQHQETTQVLEKILEAVSVKQDIPAPVVNVSPPIVNLPAPVVNLPAPVVNIPAPIVNVEKNDISLNQDKVVEAVELLRTDLAKSRPLAEWQFDLIKNEDGVTLSIYAKQLK